MNLTVNEDRYAEIFQRLTRDGATTAGGLNRPALSDAHLAARATFRDLIRENRFEIRTDSAGNLSAFWRCPEADAPTLMLGSHLDSVPDGGRFDGTLGVAAAFEAALTLRNSGLPLKVNLEVMDFTDEEGTWISLMGSRALSGQLKSPEDIRHPHGDPHAFRAALAQAGLTPEGILEASRPLDQFAAYLEMHIEQGMRLIEGNARIGIVTGMVGIHKFLVTFKGMANHAGTTPMDRRRDAALGASLFCLAVRNRTRNEYTDCVANVGRMDFKPGAFNIVPEQVAVSMELRSASAERANRMEQALRDEAASAAGEFQLEVEFEPVQSVKERLLDGHICQTMEAACDQLGLAHKRLPSLAGHDAQSMARGCPSGLIFIPSAGGISHSESEFSEWADCIAGANALLLTAQSVATTQ